MPSWPVLLTTTSAPLTVVPLMPAIKVFFCVPWMPMRMVLDSSPKVGDLEEGIAQIWILLLPATMLFPPWEPRPMLSLPLVLSPRASTPLAVLLLPMVLTPRALTPLAVFSLPLVLSPGANVPLAVLKKPVVLPKRASNPNALLLMPVVLFWSAPVPHAVLFSFVGPVGPHCANAVLVHMNTPSKSTPKKIRSPRQTFSILVVEIP